MAEEKYNFMSGASGSLPMGAFQRASQTMAASRDPYYQLNTAIKQHELEAARWTMHAKAFDMQMQIRQKEGLVELHSFLSDKDFSDPATYSGALAIAAKNGLDEQSTSPLFKRMNDGILMRERINLLNARSYAGGTSSAISNLAKYTELTREMDEANASGDPFKAKMAADRMDFFKKQTMSEAEQGISRPLSQGEILRAVIGLTKPTALEELTGAERTSLDAALSTLGPLIEKMRSVTGRPSAQDQQVPPPVDPDDPLDLGLWD